MAKKKTSRLQELQDYAKSVGLLVATYNPGNGTTRYRFFDKPGPGQTYFGPASGMHTALGLKKAWDFIYSYGAGYSHRSHHATKKSPVTLRGGGRSHARKKKITHLEAKQLLQSAGIDFSLDSDQLRMSDAQLVADTARKAGYRKRKDAPGSTSRMYFQYLKRL